MRLDTSAHQPCRLLDPFRRQTPIQNLSTQCQRWSTWSDFSIRTRSLPHFLSVIDSLSLLPFARCWMQAAQRLSNVATHLARSVMTDSALSHGPKELQNKGLVLLLAQTPNGAYEPACADVVS